MCVCYMLHHMMLFNFYLHAKLYISIWYDLCMGFCSLGFSPIPFTRIQTHALTVVAFNVAIPFRLWEFANISIFHLQRVLSPYHQMSDDDGSDICASSSKLWGMSSYEWTIWLLLPILWNEDIGKYCYYFYYVSYMYSFVYAVNRYSIPIIVVQIVKLPTFNDYCI